MSTEFKLKTLTNPLPEDFKFRYDNQWYSVPAYKTVSMPGGLAVHGAKHLANKILINKGKFADALKDDKVVPGLSVKMGERDYIASQLLDVRESELDLDEIINKSKDAPAKDRLPEGEPMDAITEAPVGTVTVKGSRTEKEQQQIDGNRDQLMARYEELKKRWPKVNAAERAEYKQLKIDLNISSPVEGGQSTPETPAEPVKPIESETASDPTETTPEAPVAETPTEPEEKPTEPAVPASAETPDENDLQNK